MRLCPGPAVAIQAGGGPVLGFCGGRVDDFDGSESLPLGPATESQARASEEA
jgi:catalase-peroxidase